MTIELTPELAQLIQTQINAGRFQTPVEVVQAALHLLDDRGRDFQDVESLKAEIAIGIAQADRGELIDGETVFDEIERQFASPDDQTE